MNLEKQIEIVTSSIQDFKGEDVKVLKILEQSCDIEALIITTARSKQHARGIANNIKIEAKRLNMKILGMEGSENGDWVLLDLAEIVVHIMTKQTRDFYKLEKLWIDANNAD